MKLHKLAATAVLGILLLAACVAAECLALAKYTVLNPSFFGKGESDAYELIGRVVVQRLSEGVLEKAPPIALRTTDGRRAYELASEALPPGQVSGMLESSGPDVARYLLEGGDAPVLNGAAQFEAGETALMKSLLMDDLLKVLPEKPVIPAFMPFTPEWNELYASQIAGPLALPRYYIRFRDYALAAMLAAVAFFAGLIYLVWLRERKPFFLTIGALFAVNGLLAFSLAAAISFWCKPMAEGAAALPAFSGAASVFASDWPALVQAALWPFRQIFLVASVASLSVGAAAFAYTASLKNDVAADAVAMGKPRHRKPRPPLKEVLKEAFSEEKVETESAAKPKPRHGKKTGNPPNGQ
jgi:hypothetical protein